MAEEISGEYELVFHGPIDYSEEAVAHLKKVMSESFGLSAYAVDLFFEKAPFPIKKAKSCEELEQFLSSLRDAGGDVSIRHPNDEPITQIHIVDPRKKRAGRENSDAESADSEDVMTFDFEELADGEFSEQLDEAKKAVESMSDIKPPPEVKIEQSKTPPKKETQKEEAPAVTVQQATSTPSFELEDTGPEFYGKKDTTPKSAVVLEAKNRVKPSQPIALEIEESEPAKPDHSKIELIAKLRNKEDTGSFKRDELNSSTASSQAQPAPSMAFSMDDGSSESAAPVQPAEAAKPAAPPPTLSFGLDSEEEGQNESKPEAQATASEATPKPPAPPSLGLNLEPLDAPQTPSTILNTLSLNLNEMMEAGSSPAPGTSAAPLPAGSVAENKDFGLNLNMNLGEEEAPPTAPIPTADVMKSDTFDLNLGGLKEELAKEVAQKAESSAQEQTTEVAENSGQEVVIGEMPLSAVSSLGLSVAPEAVPVIEAKKIRRSLIKQYAAPAGLFFGLILLLGGMNWFYFSSKSERELGTLAAQLFNSPIFVAFQEHALELVVAKRSMKPPVIRYWKGHEKTPQLDAEMTFATADLKVTTAEMSIQATEPPPLTPEQIVRQEKGIPWMRRITASAFQWEFKEDGSFTAKAPGRLSIEWGQKMHRAIADVELHGKVDLTTMLISTDVTIRANIDDPTGLPLVFIEPIAATTLEDEGRFRIYVSTQVKSQFMNALDLEKMTREREEKERSLANAGKKEEPKKEPSKKDDDEE